MNPTHDLSPSFKGYTSLYGQGCSDNSETLRSRYVEVFALLNLSELDRRLKDYFVSIKRSKDKILEAVRLSTDFPDMTLDHPFIEQLFLNHPVVNTFAAHADEDLLQLQCLE
jgi:hypothetical protein